MGSCMDGCRTGDGWIDSYGLQHLLKSLFVIYNFKQGWWNSSAPIFEMLMAFSLGSQNRTG